MFNTDLTMHNGERERIMLFKWFYGNTYGNKNIVSWVSYINMNGLFNVKSN